MNDYGYHSQGNETVPPEVALEYCACPMGCPPGEEHVLHGRDRLHDLPGQFNIVRCATCGLMRTNPRPTRETIHFYYPANYGPHQAGANGSDPARPKSFLRRLLNTCVQFNVDRIPPVFPGRLFEVGCGSGGFLKKMTALGWQVEGIELATAPARRLRREGFNVHEGSLEDFVHPVLPPDMVVGWMVLEHLYDPIGGLRKIHSWLSADGWLVLSVPNETVRFAKWSGEAWCNLHLPAHLLHFDLKSVSRMLNRAGFHVERVFHQRLTGPLLETVGNVLDDRSILPGVANFCRQAASSALINYGFYPLGLALGAMGETGRITLWARKK